MQLRSVSVLLAKDIVQPGERAQPIMVTVQLTIARHSLSYVRACGLARRSLIAVPLSPHQVTQRGNVATGLQCCQPLNASGRGVWDAGKLFLAFGASIRLKALIHSPMHQYRGRRVV